MEQIMNSLCACSEAEYKTQKKKTNQFLWYDFEPILTIFKKNKKDHFEDLKLRGIME